MITFDVVASDTCSELPSGKLWPIVGLRESCAECLALTCHEMDAASAGARAVQALPAERPGGVRLHQREDRGLGARGDRWRPGGNAQKEQRPSTVRWPRASALVHSLLVRSSPRPHTDQLWPGRFPDVAQTSSPHLTNGTAVPTHRWAGVWVTWSVQGIQ